MTIWAVLAAAAPVHTAGINWAGLLANILGIGGAVGGLVAFTLSRLDKRRATELAAADKRRAEHEQWVTRTVAAAVQAASAVLGHRIDGIDGKLSKLATHLDDQDRSVNEVKRRTYRMETRLMRDKT